MRSRSRALRHVCVQRALFICIVIDARWVALSPGPGDRAPIGQVENARRFSVNLSIIKRSDVGAERSEERQRTPRAGDNRSRVPPQYKLLLFVCSKVAAR